MGEADHTSVVNDMRLADGTVWTMPIILTVDDVTMGNEIALRNSDNRILAIMAVEEKYI